MIDPDKRISGMTWDIGVLRNKFRHTVNERHPSSHQLEALQEQLQRFSFTVAEYKARTYPEPRREVAQLPAGLIAALEDDQCRL